MKLKEFRVTNYRSVNDSGPIEIRERTALVGRNESGKTNLLLALKSLNPPDGVKALSFVKDFPRDRHSTDFSEDLPVVETTWVLTESESRELEKIFPRAKDIKEVQVGRYYKRSRWVHFIGLSRLVVNQSEVKANLKKIQQSVKATLRDKDANISQTVSKALEIFSGEITSNLNTKPLEWSAKAETSVTKFRQALSASSFSIPNLADTNLKQISRHITELKNDDTSYTEGRNWIVSHLPVFIFLDEYPELEGHQNIPALISRSDGPTPADENFNKLTKVAGLDPRELNKLLQADHEKRQQLANRAGAVVTRKIRELWTDRALKVRFNLDADHFDTLISDPTSVYDVEVNLNERSRGFKWFFSFYITFAADTADGPAENAILLLDEPGLYLHAIAQRDLLRHFTKDFKNQILYTTHSPFMIPVDDLPSIRTVNIDPETGTNVSNDPTGDARTLFPLQTALGYDLTQTLFVGEKNLIVEGVSDYWYLSSISDYLNSINSPSLPVDLVITPSGGAQKVSYMVALLTSQNLKVLVLLDDEMKARDTAQEMVQSKLIRDDSVVFVSEAFGTSPMGGADIEDLLDPDVYAKLVEETYAKELERVALNINNNIPRIVKRYEEAFKQLNILFHKTRPAKLFLRRIAENPVSVMTNSSRERFETLFNKIVGRLEAQTRRNQQSFR